MPSMRISKSPAREAPYRNPVEAFYRLKKDHPQWWKASSRSEVNSRPWPVARVDPSKTPVFAHNETFIDAPPSAVFAKLTDANGWASFYPNARDVKLPAGSTELTPGLRFTWTTFGAKQSSKVQEYEKDRVLGWTAKSPGTLAYHRWILVPEGKGTRLITEETQRGLTAQLDQLLMNPALHASHQLWLEQMKKVLEG
jgi:uncharacterized protein YndB with AHSA1/START domain